jgi:hypothetical protein
MGAVVLMCDHPLGSCQVNHVGPTRPISGLDSPFLVFHRHFVRVGEICRWHISGCGAAGSAYGWGP